ncbi:MAG TPA: hypothetical protein VMN60_14065 [Longimicrobiales bacterium]|nr:hypothetical protein [Longimicrobiales bacterium]
MKRWLFSGLVAVAVLVGAADGARAQTRADSAAVLLNAAEQLRVQGETGAARALLALIERQFAGTPAAQEVVRMRALLRRMPDAERSGRTELLVFGTTYGAWLGIATPLMFDADASESYGLGLLLGAPIGFFAAKSYADTYAPTEGQTRALTFGGMWGTWQGFALAEILDIGQEEICPPPGSGGECFESGVDGSQRVTAAVIGGLAGIAAGAVIAQKPITSGTAAAVTLSGMWGSWFGGGMGVLLDQEGDALLTSIVLGGNAALIAAGLTAPAWQMSESRARLISLGGLVGGLGGAGLVLLLQPESEKVAIGIPLTTSALGLLTGAHWTRDRDAPTGGGDDAGGSALLNLRHARWSVAVPMPGMQLRRAGSGAAASAYVPLISARF